MFTKLLESFDASLPLAFGLLEERYSGLNAHHIWRLSDQYSSIMSLINYTAKSPRGEAMHSTGDKVSKVDKES